MVLEDSMHYEHNDVMIRGYFAVSVDYIFTESVWSKHWIKEWIGVPTSLIWSDFGL